MSNINFNVKSGKAFRDKLALWYIASFKIADEIVTRDSRIKEANRQKATNDDNIKRLAEGDKGVLRTLDEINKDNERIDKEIATERARVDALKKEQANDIEQATSLFSKDFIKVISASLDDIYNYEKKCKAFDAMAEFFVANGFEDANAENVSVFMDALGQKRASARKKCETHKHNTVGGHKELVDILLGAICEEPNFNKMMPLYKWTNIIEKKVSKKN